MTVNNFKDLETHIGHELEAVGYSGRNVAIECIECGTVLLDYEKEDIE